MAASPYAQPGWRDPLYPEPRAGTSRIEERPLPWLGPSFQPDKRRTLDDLVEDGRIDRQVSTTLAALARGRASLLVIGGPSGCGKTTLLEAVLPCYPDGDRRIRLRGAGESFNWARDPGLEPTSSVLIAEEISGFLPSYLWGPAVGTFLDWGSRGAALVATAHGTDPTDVVALLSGYPLRLPVDRITAFDLIVRVGERGTAGKAGRVDTAWIPAATPGGGVCFERVLLDRPSEVWASVREKARRR